MSSNGIFCPQVWRVAQTMSLVAVVWTTPFAHRAWRECPINVAIRTRAVSSLTTAIEDPCGRRVPSVAPRLPRAFLSAALVTRWRATAHKVCVFTQKLNTFYGNLTYEYTYTSTETLYVNTIWYQIYK